jgi:hypothetical protein
VTLLPEMAGRGIEPQMADRSEVILTGILLGLYMLLFVYIVREEAKHVKRGYIRNFAEEKKTAAAAATRDGKSGEALSIAIDLIDSFENRTTWRLAALQAIVLSSLVAVGACSKVPLPFFLITIMFTSWLLSTLAQHWERSHGYAEITEGAKCILKLARGESEASVHAGPLWYRG